MAVFQYLRITIWAVTWQNQQNGMCAQQNSDQPGHPPSLIRVFAARMKKPWALSCPLNTQRSLWSDWADASAQSDLSIRWVHSDFVGFVMLRLNYSERPVCSFGTKIKHVSNYCLFCNFTQRSYKNFWFKFYQKKTRYTLPIPSFRKDCISVFLRGTLMEFVSMKYFFGGSLLISSVSMAASGSSATPSVVGISA